MSLQKAMFVHFLVLASLSAVHADIISDITGSEADAEKALKIKAEQFWTPVLEAAESVHMEAHMALYDEATAALSELSSDHTYVREALQESLIRLRAADEAVFKQALLAKDVALEKLRLQPADSESFSFLTGGQNFLKAAVTRFVSGGSQYQPKLLRQVEQRQADVLPVLRGAADATGNVLQDCRLAAKRAFDLLKYDIYNRDVPKTPQRAKDVANRLVDASSETRRHFTKSIISAVNGITHDVLGRHDDASATVARDSVHTSMAALESSEEAHQPALQIGEASLKPFGQGSEEVASIVIDL